MLPSAGEGGAHSCTQSPISETFEDPPPASASSLTTLAIPHSFAAPQTYEAYSTSGPLHEPFSLEHTPASSFLFVLLLILLGSASHGLLL